MKLLTSACLDGYGRKKDKSVSIRFVTQEKTSQQIAEIDSMIDMFGYLYFKAEEELTKAEMSELDELDTELYDNPKTKAQRLRNVLYKVWEQDKPGNEFKEYYAHKMESLIEHFKDKLE